MTCILAFRKWIRIFKSWKTIWHFPFWISVCWRAWAAPCPHPGCWTRRWCRTRCTSCSSSSRPRRPARRPWCRSAAARGWSARTGESLKLGGGLLFLDFAEVANFYGICDILRNSRNFAEFPTFCKFCEILSNLQKFAEFMHFCRFCEISRDLGI